MNSLSWMIYAASVMDNLKAVSVAIAVVSGGAILVFAGVFAGLAAEGDMPAGSWKAPARWTWLPVVTLILAAILPSASTVYLIAASEAGETVVRSPEAKEMLGDLRDIIRKKLKEELSDASDTTGT